MVVYEAARAMVNLRNVTARELAPAVSSKPVYKQFYIASLLSLFLSFFSSADVPWITKSNNPLCSCEDLEQGKLLENGYEVTLNL